ncbi:hypothetical protein ONS95_010065 [Cadophora gregata]|uniref:uncharacterized protein n=1 Tax=Cadophora gregata TaxID=51156 RepID=UPI0026DD1780|nr:uncharacterized protein ONS95_010065 [Cadophora gregata]KAK0121782.1 hypothetical protein ONS95_010065 [Cadophora gregata]KAK0127257.1 hypothetical protein ONS96_006808 [Cadophora gregata f. sp. sojae]
MAPWSATMVKNLAEDIKHVIKQLKMRRSRPLTEFHLFPKLPIELRREIFKHAVPVNKHEILYLDLQLRAADEEFGLYFTFGFMVEWQHQVAKKLGSLALLSTCVESREVYIEMHRGTLPLGFGRVIRYNPDNTTIFIPLFEKFRDSCHEGIRYGWRLQKWFTEIKHLATSPKNLVAEKHPHGAFMAAFKNLETWTAVVDPRSGQTLASWERLMRVTQRDLEAYKKLEDPAYKVPRLLLNVD